MDRHKYIQEGYRQLSDTDFYMETDIDMTKLHYDKVKQKLDQMLDNKEITEKTYRYLSTNNDRTALLYLLPKIHKNATNPPGRPIVSGNDCPTEKISQMLDIILQPFVPKIKSYIKDTSDFIRKLKKLRKLPPNAWLIIADVQSLYTKIPHDEGKAAAEKALNSRDPQQNPSTASLMDLLDLVLTCNNFDFNGKHYVQTNGTAMGTRVAPTYANLFMADFEEKYIYTLEKQPLVWWRFIDDIFSIFVGTEDEVKQFTDKLNTLHPIGAIKFTVEYSKEKVNFLDTTVYIKDNRLVTTLYTKPTDSHSYLNFDSCHHMHNKLSIPYSQFLRVRRICTHWTEYITNALTLYNHLLIRGYPRECLNQAILKVSKLSQKEALAEKDQNNSSGGEGKKSLYFISDFNPTNPDFKAIIQKYWPLLDRSSGTRALTDCNLIFGYRRPKNIRDIVTSAKLPKISDNRTPTPNPTPTLLPRQTKCKRKTCRHCPKIDNSGKVQNHLNNRQYICDSKANCQTNNVIYLLTCDLCKKQYVGQTLNRIMDRVNHHLNDIKHRRETPISRHMQSHGTVDQYPVTIQILQRISAAPKSTKAQELRYKWETSWMAWLNSYVPNGLNIKD